MNAIALNLPRIELPSFNLMPKELSIRAADVLQYSPGHNAREQANLFEFLGRQGALPYSPPHVEAYKYGKMMAERKKREGFLKRTFNSDIEWRLCEFRAYDAPIPESIIRLSVDVAKFVGSGNVRIDYLGSVDLQHDYDERMARVYDPFVVVRALSSMPWHHIAVWDEPTFQG